MNLSGRMLLSTPATPASDASSWCTTGEARRRTGLEVAREEGGSLIDPPSSLFWWRRRALPPASERAPDKTSTSVSYSLVLALTAACRRASTQASPEKFLASRVRDSPGRNSPLVDATTLVHGAYRQRSVRRHFSRPLLTQLERNRCWQLNACGQFYEATAPRLAILNAASPVETNSPPCYMVKPKTAYTRVQSSSRPRLRIARPISRSASRAAMSSRLS